MKALVIGSGGREHALAWALQRSEQMDTVYVAPGNGGTHDLNIPIPADDFEQLAAFAQAEAVDLTIVGPEAPLAAGIVDYFQARGLLVFGPTKAAAQLEASKAFAKQFMQDYDIPTAQYGAFADYEAAMGFLEKFDKPVVVKADGLAAGKGVLICESREEAQSALKTVMLDRAFGAAGDWVVIEERLTGPEISVLAFSDGRTLCVMPPARDHKRAYDGDHGPNTGGMGAFAPAPDISLEMIAAVEQQVLRPVVRGMAERGTPYVGILYAGLMLTPAGAKVLEFNCRFGDPETQVILPLLETDLVDVLLACITGRLDQTPVRWSSGACATVVLAAPGYPESYPKGLVITGLEAANTQDCIVFHAGTTRQNDELVTAGGRVLAVTGRAADLPLALQRAYEGIAHIHFEGMHYRRDIGGYVGATGKQVE